MTRRNPQAKTSVLEPAIEEKDVRVAKKDVPFFCPVPSCAKNDQKNFAGWKTIKPMINCVEKHCLHGGFESVPKPFWNERFYCLQCGTIVSNSHRGSHDNTLHRELNNHRKLLKLLNPDWTSNTIRYLRWKK